VYGKLEHLYNFVYEALYENLQFLLKNCTLRDNIFIVLLYFNLYFFSYL